MPGQIRRPATPNVTKLSVDLAAAVNYKFRLSAAMRAATSPPQMSWITVDTRCLQKIVTPVGGA
jgi:hypothetical protein